MTGVDLGRFEARRAEDACRVAESLPRPSLGRHAGTMTKMEARVLKTVGLGLSNAEIADAFGISIWTVRVHLKHIHDKCAVPGRARLTVAALAMEREV